MRFSLPAFVIILQFASAPTASAECAWVLWKEMDNTILPPYAGGGKTWDTPLAYPDRASCVAVITDTIKAWNARPRSQEPVNIFQNGAGVEITTQGKEGSLRRSHYCLPDTVDPRGPKGK